MPRSKLSLFSPLHPRHLRSSNLSFFVCHSTSQNYMNHQPGFYSVDMLNEFGRFGKQISVHLGNRSVHEYFSRMFRSAKFMLQGPCVPNQVAAVSSYLSFLAHQVLTSAPSQLPYPGFIMLQVWYTHRLGVRYTTYSIYMNRSAPTHGHWCHSNSLTSHFFVLYVFLSPQHRYVIWY